jgi:hypothetical protein
MRIVLLSLSSLLFLSPASFARDAIPPSEVKVVISGLSNSTHNGTFTCSGRNTPNKPGVLWTYIYTDDPITPRFKVVVTINGSDDINVTVGPGQFADGVYAGTANITTSPVLSGVNKTTGTATLTAVP